MSRHARETQTKGIAAGTIFALAFYPLLLLYLVFALPLVGNFAFPLWAHDAIHNCGVPVSNSGVTHCFKNGVDIGALSYNYSMTIFILGLVNPLLAFKAVRAMIPTYVLVPWMVLVVWSFIAKRRLSSG